MNDDILPKGQDGFYHPSTHEELAALVRHAHLRGLQFRVRGSVHSVGRAIYTDPASPNDFAVGKQTPPPGNNLNVMLDKYRGFRLVEGSPFIVEVDAGTHLGVDPSDPTRTSTLEDSLLFRLWKEHGLTLSDLGGITHQTVSGFISMGSSGGSLLRSVYDNVVGLKMIDGRGNTYEVRRDDADPEPFHATVTSMGLLGVISKVLLKCEPTFDIAGQEAITTYADCEVDLFGDGTPGGKPSMERFLKEAEYTRLEWWPQRGGERMVTWRAARTQPQPESQLRPYQEFGDDPETTQALISIFFTVIGNLDDLNAARRKLKDTAARVPAGLEQLRIFDEAGPVGKILGAIIGAVLDDSIDLAIALLAPAVPHIKAELPRIFLKVLGLAIPLDSTKKGALKGEPQRFLDHGWSGLPMDNQASDVLLPTEFTELWIPIQYSKRVMNLLNDFFRAPSSAREALERTGTYAFELYGAKPNPHWMSMSYSDGKDEWKDGVLRVDAYWFVHNARNPSEKFFPRFWNLLRDAGIPFRLHWGKRQPMNGQDWVAFFKKQYPRWDDFLARRQEMDPNNIFLTDYWRQRFGLEHLPRPKEL